MGTSIFGRFVLTFTTATLLAHEDSQSVAHAARHLSCVPGRNKRLPRPSKVSLFPHLPYLADLFSRLQRLRYSRMKIRRVHAARHLSCVPRRNVWRSMVCCMALRCRMVNLPRL